MTTYKDIPENTFGSTPAAMYLCRLLNEGKKELLRRSVGRRITGTASQVNQLIRAYEYRNINPKTLANCLRLMREEISVGEFGITIEEQLCRNVQIGYIKQGIRLATIGRKAERVMVSPESRSTKITSEHTDDGIYGEYFFKDSESGALYKAGESYQYIDDTGRQADDWNGADWKDVNRLKSTEVNHITPELLHERSLRRCIRLNKPHTK
jgi:hypothetical protein